jgi:hypothetical protein
LTLGEDETLVGVGILRAGLGDGSGFSSICFRIFPLLLLVDGISLLSF